MAESDVDHEFTERASVIIADIVANGKLKRNKSK